MRRWMKKALFVLLLSLAGLLLAAGAGLLWLVTDSGRTWLTAEIEKWSAGTLHIEQLRGNPLSAWSAGRLLYADAGSRVEIDGLEIAWNPWQLLTGRMHLRRITADALQVTVPAGPSTIDIEALWPVWVVQLDRLALGSVEYHEEGQALTHFSRLEMDHIELGPTLNGQWAVENETWRMHGRLDGKPKTWTSRIGMAAISGGDHLELEFQGKGSKAGSLRLDGELASTQLAMSGDWTRSGNIIKGEGGLSMQQGPVLHAGTWGLQTDIGTAATEARIKGTSTGVNLLRALQWRVSARRESDGRMYGELSETAGSSEKNELQLQWQMPVPGRWTAKGELEHWSVPVKGADGTLSGVFTAEYQDTGWQMNVAISEGRMGGLAASLDVQAHGLADSWKLVRGHMQMLGLTMSATGQGDAGHVHVAGKLSSENLHQAFTLAGLEGSGRLNGSFAVSGSPEHPMLTWQGEGRAIKLDEAEIGRVSAQGSWLHISREGEVKLSASGLRWQKKRWADLQMQAKLGKDAVSFAGKADGDIAAAWRLQGQKKPDGGWQGSLDQMDVRDAEAQWLQVRDMPWLFDGERLNLERTALKLFGHAALLAGDLGKSQLDINLDMTDMPLQVLAPWFKSTLSSIAGKASLHARLGGAWDNPELDMKVTADEVKLVLAGNEDSLPPPILKQVNADISVHRESLGWKAAASMSQAGSIDTSGDIPWLFSLQPYAFEPAQQAGGQARLAVELADLASLQAWLPRIDPLSGKAKLNLVVDQPLGKVAMSGDGEFDLPGFGIPEFGLDMSGKGRVVWQGEGGQLDLSFTSGKGSMLTKGAFSISEKKFPEIVFKKFQLMNTPDQQLVVDGYLAGKNKDGNLWLLGELTADPLLVVLPEIQPRATQDLVWEEEKPAGERFKNLRLTRLDVGLNLADHGQISGRGMRMQLGGKLRFGGSVAYPMLTGNLNIVSGGIDYRNIHLDVLPDSHVVFTGDPDRPLLHVRAGRRVDGMLVGVAIDGPADRPFSELFSEPVMTQAEILSYLATGRPLASLGQSGSSDAISLAGFLLGSGTGGQGLQDKVRQSLALDELTVDAGADRKSVGAAKRLGEKTTVRLEEVVTTQASTAVTLEYKLFKSLSLFTRKVQNLAPMVGLKLSHEWPGEKVQAED